MKGQGVGVKDPVGLACALESFIAMRIRLGPMAAAAGTVKLPLRAKIEAPVLTTISPVSAKSPSRLTSIQMVHAIELKLLPPGVSV